MPKNLRELTLKLADKLEETVILYLDSYDIKLDSELLSKADSSSIIRRFIEQYNSRREGDVLGVTTSVVLGRLSSVLPVNRKISLDRVDQLLFCLNASEYLKANCDNESIRKHAIEVIGVLNSLLSQDLISIVVPEFLRGSCGVVNLNSFDQGSYTVSKVAVIVTNAVSTSLRGNGATKIDGTSNLSKLVKTRFFSKGSSKVFVKFSSATADRPS